MCSVKDQTEEGGRGSEGWSWGQEQWKREVCECVCVCVSVCVCVCAPQAFSAQVGYLPVLQCSGGLSPGPFCVCVCVCVCVRVCVFSLCSQAVSSTKEHA